MVTDYLNLANLSLLSWLIKHLYTALIGKLYFITLIYTCKLSSYLIIRLSNVILYHRERKRGTVLEWAAIHNYIFTFKSLLKKLKANIYLKNLYGNTLLHLLVGQGKTILIKLLLEAGADILKYNISGFILLHFTAKWGFMDTVQLLINKGTDIFINQIRDLGRDF
jgi:ankyrin repeat protein